MFTLICAKTREFVMHLYRSSRGRVIWGSSCHPKFVLQTSFNLKLQNTRWKKKIVVLLLHTTKSSFKNLKNSLINSCGNAIH